jgi:hypothetical protein
VVRAELCFNTVRLFHCISDLWVAGVRFGEPRRIIILTMSERQKLLICLPGEPFVAEWVNSFGALLVYLCAKFFVEVRFSTGNNIYLVRNVLAREAEKLKPDYVLWIDSDNPPSLAGFDSLYVAMENQDNQDVSILGAWYYFVNTAGEVKIAAGWHPATPENQITEEPISAATGLYEVGYIGLGFCLMRGQVFQDTAPAHFRPMDDNRSPDGFMTDDAGFCELARLNGHKTYLHPAVRVEHLKVLKVPAPAGQKERGNSNGNRTDSGNQQPELQIVDAHGA